MSYNQPTVFNIPNPKGLDKALANIQTDLAGLTWLAKIYGRAYSMLEYEAEGKRRISTSEGIKPKVWVGKETGAVGEYANALPNDYINSYSFFVAETAENFPDFSNSSINHVNREVSLIVWVRLDKINSSKTYPFTEELKEEIYTKLKSNRSIKLTRYEDETSAVWEGFDWSSEENKNLRFPNMGMRFYFTLSYNDKTC